MTAVHRADQFEDRRLHTALRAHGFQACRAPPSKERCTFCRMLQHPLSKMGFESRQGLLYKDRQSVTT